MATLEEGEGDEDEEDEEKEKREEEKGEEGEVMEQTRCVSVQICTCNLMKC